MRNKPLNTLLLRFLTGLILFNASTCIPIWERLTTADLDQIRKRGKLQVITAYNANSYFIYRGEPMGYEYELVKRLADHLELELEIIVSSEIENLPYLLNTGKGDLVAANISMTGERIREVQFTEPLILTRQVLVQKSWESEVAEHEKKQDSLLNRSALADKADPTDSAVPGSDMDQAQPARDAQFLNDAASVIAGETGLKQPVPRAGGLIRNPIELMGQPVFVRRGSPSFQRLKHLEQEMGGEIDIHIVPGDVITEDLIRQVYLGKIRFTVADEPTALINKAYYNNLDVSTPIGFSQRIGWVVRPHASQLLTAINNWIRQIKGDGTLVTIYNRYYRNPRAFRSRVDSEFYSERGERISSFDPIIQAAAKAIEWDWRLLSALIYQESRFDPRARSWAGASGLMQLMPATGAAMGARNLFDPTQNITAGSRYLAQLDKTWQATIQDDSERMNFVLASYNAGPGHVEDARFLTAYFGKDPDRWTDVSEYMLKLSDPQYYNRAGVKYGYVRGEEPYNYVSEIQERFVNYKKFFDDPGPQANSSAQAKEKTQPANQKP
ncbi:MAG: transporter substrate-binding domain-containing protein [Leptospiraceae bacterium]|nr:transporter substrate-binding domain-containing protein [Leptospiraceae bacterium]